MDNSSKIIPINRALVFYGFVTILTIVSLSPIWLNRILPMQDYPQHLFLSHIIATYDNPSFNWKEYYTVDLGLRPYHLWYLVMKPLSLLFGTEAAGKLLFSIYILMMPVLVLASRRLCPKGVLPWGALTLYPFAFNQIYFMGFSNFIISLPVLYLAVMDLNDMVQGYYKPLKNWLHAFYLVIIYLNHPYTLIVYVCLAITAALYCSNSRKIAIKLLVPTIASVSVLALWILIEHGPSSAPNPYEWRITWIPLSFTAAFYTIMFTGMRLTNGPELLSLISWLAIGFVIFYSWRYTEETTARLKMPISLFLVSIAGYIILPAWFGYYAYFNLRLAPISYFMLAFLFSHLRIKQKAGISIAILSLILIASSVRTQTNVSESMAEILPLFDKTENNALILPLIFSSQSTVLDPVIFYKFYIHNYNYYHVVAGGGANPALFRNAMLPVQYKQEVKLPYPEHPTEFLWTQHGYPYRYFILRNPPLDFSNQLRTKCDFIARSGAWELFRRK